MFIRLALAGPFLFSRNVVSRKQTHDSHMSPERNRVAFRRGKVWSLM